MYRKKIIAKDLKTYNLQPSEGFTLLEVLLYSAILAVFLGFALVSARSVFVTNSLILDRSEILTNQEFIESKLAWIVSHAKSFDLPVAGDSSAGATISTNLSSTDPAVFAVSGDDLVLSLAGGPSYALNNNKVKILYGKMCIEIIRVAKLFAPES